MNNEINKYINFSLKNPNNDTYKENSNSCSSYYNNYPCCKRHYKNNSNFPKKRRSDWFYLANETFSKIIDLGVKFLALTEVIFYFKLWRENYRENFIRFVNGNIYLFSRQFSRFDKPYKRKLKRKLQKLNSVQFDLKLELTLDPKLFFTLKNEFDFISKNWNRLRSWLKKRFGDFEYIGILEVMKKGRPHLHILLFFWDTKIKYLFKSKSYEFWSNFNRDLYNIWGFGRVHTTRIYNRNNLRAVKYILKYVMKTLDQSKDENLIYPALLFASNKRLYNLSRYLSKLVNKKDFDKDQNYNNENIKFRYDGIVEAYELKKYCNKKGIPLKDCIYIEVYSNSDFWEYPIIFNIE